MFATILLVIWQTSHRAELHHPPISQSCSLLGSHRISWEFCCDFILWIKKIYSVHILEYDCLTKLAESFMYRKIQPAHNTTIWYQLYIIDWGRRLALTSTDCSMSRRKSCILASFVHIYQRVLALTKKYVLCYFIKSFRYDRVIWSSFVCHYLAPYSVNCKLEWFEGSYDFIS